MLIVKLVREYLNEMNLEHDQDPNNVPKKKIHAEEQVEEYIKLVKDKIDIADWDSPQGKIKRKKLSETLNNIISNLTTIIHSSLTKKDKAKKVRDFMKNTGWLSFCIGVWNAVSNTVINKPKLDIWNLDWTSGSIELGGTFWLKVAAFLFVLRLLHKIISTGTILFMDITNFWKNIKTFFTGNLREEFLIEYDIFLLENNPLSS